MNNPTGSPHPSVEQLRTFGLGQLEATAAAVVEEHVSHCEACCRTLAEVRSDTFTDLLRSAHQVPADGASTLAPKDGPAVAGPGAVAEDGRTSAEAPAAPAVAGPPPELLRHPRYRVLGLLGSGGMGAVYKAEHLLMERLVALKVMTPALVGNAAGVERFRHEFKASARLAHPNIVAAYDAEQAGDLHFLVMEYVEGTDLARWVAERGPLPVAEACDYVRQAARGLQHAHEHGMIHRDVKPHNLMRTRNGTVKILDFGLARLAAEAGSGPGAVTGQGTLLGTVDYLAPEQADDARQADIRSDVYSLGCTLYHLLSGRPPFPRGTLVQKVMAHTERQPQSLLELRPDLPPGLARVVERMMAKPPEQRYQTPAEVAAALEPFAGGTLVRERIAAEAPGGRVRRMAPDSRRRRWAVLAVGLLLALGGLAAVAVYRIETDNGELVITSDDPDVEVLIKRNGNLVRVVDTKTGKEVKLDSGRYELELKGQPDDLKLSLDKVTIRRGDTVVATVERRPSARRRRRGRSRSAVSRGTKGFATQLPSVGKNPRKQPQSRALLSVSAPKNWSQWEIAVNALQSRHEDRIIQVALSADGRLALSGSADRTARLWDVATGKELRKLAGQTGQVYAVAFRPDGRQALTGSDDNLLLLWDVASGEQVRSLDGHTATITGVAFSPDGRRALSGSQDGTLRLWDVETGKELRKFEGHTGGVQCVAFSPDGRRAVSGSFDRTVRLWDVDTGQELRKFEGHTGMVRSVAYCPDGRRVLSGAYEGDGTLRLWDVETGRELRTMWGIPAGIHGVAVSPDGRRALAAGRSEDVQLWDLETGQRLDRLEGHTAVGVQHAVFSADGRHALSGGSDRTLRLWRLPDPPPPGK